MTYIEYNFILFRSDINQNTKNQEFADAQDDGLDGDMRVAHQYSQSNGASNL